MNYWDIGLKFQLKKINFITSNDLLLIYCFIDLFIFFFSLNIFLYSSFLCLRMYDTIYIYINYCIVIINCEWRFYFQDHPTRHKIQTFLVESVSRKIYTYIYIKDTLYSLNIHRHSTRHKSLFKCCVSWTRDISRVPSSFFLFLFFISLFFVFSYFSFPSSIHQSLNPLLRVILNERSGYLYVL